MDHQTTCLMFRKSPLADDLISSFSEMTGKLLTEPAFETGFTSSIWQSAILPRSTSCLQTLESRSTILEPAADTQFLKLSRNSKKRREKRSNTLSAHEDLATWQMSLLMLSSQKRNSAGKQREVFQKCAPICGAGRTRILMVSERKKTPNRTSLRNKKAICDLLLV